MMTDDRLNVPRVARLCDLPRAGGCPAGAPDPGPLLGHWVNYDPGTTGIAELRAWWRAGMLRVSAASLVAGTSTGWGEAAARVFACAVDSVEAVGFTARYDSGELSVLLAAYLNNRLLVLDAYTTFAAPDPRSSYFQRDHLYLPTR